MKTLIIGATGNVGSEVAKQMAGAGEEVVAAVRDIEKARRRFGDKLEYVFFDYGDENSYRPALEGISQLFFIAPPHSTSSEPVERLFEIAKTQGVERILFSSGRTTGPIEGMPLNNIEKLVKAGGMDYTILRPGWFMQNFTTWIGFTIPSEDAFYLPAGDSKTAFIDVRDIGAVAIKILTEKGHEGKTYELTSEEALDHGEVAKIISRVAGREITYVALSEADYIKTMTEKGWTKAAAEFTVYLYGYVKTGKEAIISPDGRAILGRVPICFDKFAADFKDAWQKR